MLKTIIAGALLSVIATPALAEHPGRDWLSLRALTDAIAKQGYQVTEAEADDGHWEGEMTRNGVRYEFHADPRTGRLIRRR